MMIGRLSAAELFDQMRRKRAEKRFISACLVLKIAHEQADDSAVMISADDQNAWSKLSIALKAGGDVMGMMAWGRQPMNEDELLIYTNPRSDIGEQEQADVESFLESFSRSFHAKLIESGCSECRIVKEDFENSN